MSTALHLAFFMEGMHEVGYDKCIKVMADNQGEGCIEMVSELEQYADYLEVIAQKAWAILDDGFPGVLEYEVSSSFGSWYAKHILEKLAQPSTEEARKHILELAVNFFCQYQTEEVKSRLQATLPAVTADTFMVTLPGDALASLVEMANSHIEDIETGLEDGTYDAEDNTDLAEKHQAVKSAEAALHDYPPTGDGRTVVPVKYWDCYADKTTVDTHEFEIDDQRRSNGQAYITIAALGGRLEDMLSVTMEVNTNPLDGITHVPCAHIHFDDSGLAMSLYKIGDKILARPESDVSIHHFRETMNGHPEQLFWVK